MLSMIDGEDLKIEDSFENVLPEHASDYAQKSSVASPVVKLLTRWAATTLLNRNPA